MSRTKSLLRFLPILAIALLVYVAGNRLSQIQFPYGEEEGEHPGYFAQWFEEKKSANGTIPKWAYARWAAWDKANLVRRGSEKVFDTIIELGPKNIGGRTRAIWVDPRNESIILAGSISGGLWRSENGGSTWIPVNDQEASLSVSSITFSPFNPDIIYYSTGESRGNSADVSGNGIYKSTDGGKTFKVLPSTVNKNGFDAIWKIAHSLTDSNTLFAGTDNQGLFRSTDAGATWTQVYSGGNRQVTEILVLPNNRIIATMQSSLTVVSDSGGKPGTFSTVVFPSAPASGTYRRIQMGNCKKYPNVCYALFEGYNATSYTDVPVRFYKSSDGGRTWVSKTAPVAIGSGQQGYCVMIGVSPTDSNRVVTGAVYIAQTTNGGGSWTNKNTGHSDHHSFAGFNNSPDDYLVGTDGGIYKYKWTTTGNPTNLNNGYQVTQFYAGNFGPTGFVSISGSQDNGTQVATGKLTSKQFYGADGAFAHIGLQDGTVAYLSTQNEGIRRITDFNPNVKPTFSDAINAAEFSSEGVDFINCYLMNPGDQTQLYYRTNKSIYRSNDMGDNWVQIAKRTSIKAIGCSNESNPVLYFGGIAAQLYKLENAATQTTFGKEVNFNSVVPISVTDDNIKGITVHPKDKYTIYLAFNNFSNQPRVWRASGMDSTKPVFKNISGNLPQGLPVNSIAVDPAYPDQHFFAGTDFGLYYSTDSGKTWNKETRIPNVAVFEVKMRADRSLFIYTHGRGMWYLGLAGGNAVKTNQVIIDHSVKIYPNPAREILQIALPENTNSANYNLFDASGKAIANGSIQSPTHTMNVADLKNGYYYIQIKTPIKNYTQKILIQH